MGIECETYTASDLHYLLSALCDEEIEIDNINNEDVFKVIEKCLYSNDVELAQSAASCLLISGGELGKQILNKNLASNLPQKSLIEGIVDLLS